MSAALSSLLALFAVAPPQTVSSFDVDRYLGTWFEIASYPAFFQRGCVGTTATYSKEPDGSLRVINRCRNKTLDGDLKEAKGRAWIDDPRQPAKLKVQFFWPFKGDYWVLEVDEEYDHAVVGSPDRDYLWILSRKPTMDEETFNGIVARVREQGFDPAKLVRTPQRVP